MFEELLRRILQRNVSLFCLNIVWTTLNISHGSHVSNSKHYKPHLSMESSLTEGAMFILISVRASTCNVPSSLARRLFFNGFNRNSSRNHKTKGPAWASSNKSKHRCSFRTARSSRKINSPQYLKQWWKMKSLKSLLVLSSPSFSHRSCPKQWAEKQRKTHATFDGRRQGYWKSEIKRLENWRHISRINAR